MNNLLKDSLLSTLDGLLDSLGLERQQRHGSYRKIAPAFSWLIVGAAAGSAAAAWLMSDAGQRFVKSARELVTNMGDEAPVKRSPSNGNAGADTSHASKSSSIRQHSRAPT